MKKVIKLYFFYWLFHPSLTYSIASCYEIAPLFYNFEKVGCNLMFVVVVWFGFLEEKEVFSHFCQSCSIVHLTQDHRNDLLPG